MNFFRLTLAGCAALAVSSSALAAGPGSTHWNYKEPDKWGELSPSFAGCRMGREQSPIDIPTSQVEKAALPALQVGYRPARGEIVNNGHTIQVDLANAGSVTVPSGEYALVQFHFHGPSEERIDGKSYPLVAHLVHRNATGSLAVIAVLFKVGRQNVALAPVFQGMPRKPGKARLRQKLDVARMLPKEMGYYAFKGSLTTPPCSEGVAWHVLKQPVEISARQLKAFTSIYPRNARPIQPLNGRKVQEAG